MYANISANLDEALYAQLYALPTWTLRHHRLAHILELPQDDLRRQRALTYIEHRLRDQIGLSQDAVVDWSTQAVDWTTIIDLLIKLLPLILALFGL